MYSTCMPLQVSSDSGQPKYIAKEPFYLRREHKILLPWKKLDLQCTVYATMN
jgi:hypothetical protein